MTERAELQEAISDALRSFAVEVEQYVNDGSAAAALHRTDLNALSLAMEAADQGVRLTPGELAARMRLSPSATTTMLDRLEKAGHVVRSRDSADRRQVTITITEHAAQTGYQIFAPLARAYDEVMSAYTPAELDTIRRFLEQIADTTRGVRPM